MEGAICVCARVVLVPSSGCALGKVKAVNADVLTCEWKEKAEEFLQSSEVVCEVEGRISPCYRIKCLLEVGKVGLAMFHVVFVARLF